MTHSNLEAGSDYQTPKGTRCRLVGYTKAGRAIVEKEDGTIRSCSPNDLLPVSDKPQAPADIYVYIYRDGPGPFYHTSPADAAACVAIAHYVLAEIVEQPGRVTAREIHDIASTSLVEETSPGQVAEVSPRLAGVQVH